MKEFKVDEKLNKKVWKLFNEEDIDPMAIAEACSNFIDEDTTPYEAANLGYAVGIEAGNKPVYAVRDQGNEDVIYFCIGTPEEILQKIRDA